MRHLYGLPADRERLLRLRTAGLVMLATTALFAVGVVKNGWLEVIVLLPVVWYCLRPSAAMQNALLSIVAVCLSLSAADLILRPLLERRLSYTPLNARAYQLPRLPVLGRWDANLDIEDEVYGDLAALVGEPGLAQKRRLVLKTDAWGFRNAAVPQEADLVILGDSFGAGWGTTQDAIFSEVLRRQHGLRVYNLSYPGGPYHEYLNLALESPRLGSVPGSTVVWALYTGNDLEDLTVDVRDLDALPWNSEWGQWRVRYRTFRNRSPLNRLLATVRARQRMRTEASPVLVRASPDGRPASILFHAGQEALAEMPKSLVEQHPNFPKLRWTFQAMRRLVNSQNRTLLVLILPTKGEVYRGVLEERPWRPSDDQSSGFSQAVQGICREQTIACYDMKPYLQDLARPRLDSRADLLWWRDDTHLGEAGHKAIAAFIAEHIQVPTTGGTALGP